MPLYVLAHVPKHFWYLCMMFTLQVRRNCLYLHIFLGCSCLLGSRDHGRGRYIHTICSNTPVLRDTAKKGLVADVDSFPSPGFDEKYYRIVVCIKNIRVQVTTQHLSNARRLAYHELSAAHQYSARHRPVPSVLSSGHWQKAMLSQQEGILMTATTCTTLKNWGGDFQQ